MVKGCEIKARGKKEKAGNVPRIRTSPVEMVAIEAGFEIRNVVHD